MSRRASATMRGLALLLAIAIAGWIASPSPAAPPAEAEESMRLDRSVVLLEIGRAHV